MSKGRDERRKKSRKERMTKDDRKKNKSLGHEFRDKTERGGGGCIESDLLSRR